MIPRRVNWRERLLLGASAAVVGWLALILPLPFPQVLTHLSYELPFAVRPTQPVPEATLVLMDVPSEERLGQGRWERWDRTLHARLIDRLHAAGARAIAFDIVFQRGTNDAANAALVAAARRHGRVVVAAMKGTEVHEGRVIGATLLQPFPELAEVAAWGMAEAADETGTIREHIVDREFQIPSFAWRVADRTFPKPPAAPFDPRWVNYYGPAGTIPHVSYADALDPAFPATATFSNRVVFVGASWVAGFSGGRGADDYRSPHTLWTGRRMAGVEVCATTYVNLVRRDWLNRLSPGPEAALIGLVGLLSGLLLAGRHPGKAVVLAALAALGLAIAGLAAPALTGYWGPWLIPVALQLPLAAVATALQHTRRLQRHQHALEQTLALAAQTPSPAPAGTPAAQPTSLTSQPSQPAPAPNGTIAPVAGSPGAAPVIPGHELIRPIGRGGYGEVWLARDILGQWLAVKIVRPDPAGSGLDREFHGLQQFTPISRQHPGLVHILHVGRLEASAGLYYVMELADPDDSPDRGAGAGPAARPPAIDPAAYRPRTLASRLRAQGALPLAEGLDLAIHLAQTLAFLHAQGLVHRDLKPSNIIFVRNTAKLADIGLVTSVAAAPRRLAADATAADLAAAAARLGTEGYIPPEGPGQTAADLFSLGKVIYQMAFGFEARRFPEVPASLITDAGEEPRRALNRLLLRVCAPNPAQRPPDAGTLARELSALRATLPGDQNAPASAPPAAPASDPFSRRR